MQALQTFDLRDQEIDSGFMNHKPLISTLVFIVFSVYVYTHKYVYIYIYIYLYIYIYIHT